MKVFYIKSATSYRSIEIYYSLAAKQPRMSSKKQLAFASLMAPILVSMRYSYPFKKRTWDKETNSGRKRLSMNASGVSDSGVRSLYEISITAYLDMTPGA
jgi:hypothetical protein